MRTTHVTEYTPNGVNREILNTLPRATTLFPPMVTEGKLDDIFDATSVPLYRCSRSVLVTPEIAEYWITFNLRNRPWNIPALVKYSREMREGRWDFNGETIKFATDNKINDGQHRLRSCLETKIPFWTLVSFGNPPDTMHTVDIGVPRTVAQQMQLHDGVHRARIVVSVARLIYHHTHGGVSYMMDAKRAPTDTEIRAIILDRETEIQAAITAASGQSPMMVATSILAFCFIAFSEKHPEIAARFITDVTSGVMLAADSPATALRQRLMGNMQSRAKENRRYVTAIIFKAWLKYRDGKTMKHLKWTPHGPNPEAFPTL